ncbi:MAG: choloylglycine hydrolase family protein [Deltaproteobacteria bacterium]|nr:choloylglycine hydrolase family protein [Deltaproteobacteria bacterium]
MRKKEIETRLGVAVVTLICCLCIFAASLKESSACTGIRLMPKDGSMIYARTLEFSPTMFFSNIIIVPRGIEFTGETPTAVHGHKWKAKYGIVGMDSLGLPLLTDGLNEAGLGAGAFFHPGFAGYEKFEESKASRSIAPHDFITWILSRFATVEEVKASLDQVMVVPVKAGPWGFVAPLHYIVHDKSGKCLVIEYLGGKRIIYDNPIGILTNSPTFDWHLQNLRNFVNLNPVEIQPRDVMGLNLSPLGGGSGMHGLPGDFTPPSRFVRATFLTAQSPQAKTAFEGIRQAFRILNQFDIPKGAHRTVVDETKAMYGETVWTSAADLTNGRYFFHTINNRRLRMVDLKKVNLDAPAIVTVPLKGDQEDVLDLTPASAK